jgi:DNA topoisomerase-1
VKHGKTNATIDKESDPDTLTLEEAVALIAARAGKGKGSKKPVRKAVAKKAPTAKKAAAKPAAKKSGAKKTVAKKAPTKAKVAAKKK